MGKTNYTEQQISDLRNALAMQGVVLPQKIDAVASGGFGVCFISGKEVLKLFKTSSLPERADAEREAFQQANHALENVSEIANELKARKIKVPALIGCGEFSTTIQAGNEAFHAWQVMTRLEGRHSIKMLQTLYPIDLASEVAGTLELAKAAARLHVQVDPHGKNISEGSDSKWISLNWPQGIVIDAKTQRLLNSLRKNIELNSPRQEKTTLLHGDFHPQNIMESREGLSFIDWDQQRFGRPEMDVFLFMSLRPTHIEEYCKAYNEIATQPISEKLVVAYGLTAAVKSYVLHKNFFKIRPFINHGIQEKVAAFDLETDCDTNAYKWQMHELAKRLHQLTGNEIYAEVARDFSSSSELTQQHPQQQQQSRQRPTYAALKLQTQQLAGASPSRARNMTWPANTSLHLRR